MKKIYAVLLLSIIICMFLVTPALAIGPDVIENYKTTTNEDGSVTVTASMEKKEPLLPPGTIVPNIIKTGSSYYWQASVTSNYVLSYASASSYSYTNSTKLTYLKIDYIAAAFDVYENDGQHGWVVVGGNGDYGYDWANIYIRDTYQRHLGNDYRVNSSHEFENGSTTWHPTLVVD